MSVKIIALHPDHYNQWLELYSGYAEYYQMALTKTGIAQTWAWLHSDGSPVTGIVAQSDKQLVGLAHFRAMPSPLRGADIGFLDDLFVAKTARGMHVGEKLLNRLAVIASENDWPVVRWITRDNNYHARGLYDRLATKADWNTYEMVPK